MITITREQKDYKQICDIADKLRYADASGQEYLQWLNDKSLKFVFIKKENEKIKGFMVLTPKKKYMYLHSIYVDKKSNGLSKEFHEELIKFSKYMGHNKIRARIMRKPKSIVKRWGFNLNSYIIEKEICR